MDPLTDKADLNLECNLVLHLLPLGGIFALRVHSALLLDYVPPEEPPSTPMGNALRLRLPKLPQLANYLPFT